MMRSVFGFKTRNPGRDRETDAARFARLEGVLLEVAAEIERERAGLENRYGTVSADAAFLFEALENEAGPQGDSGRIAALTSQLQACERRVAALKKQMAFVDECRRSVGQFAQDNDMTPGPAEAV